MREEVCTFGGSYDNNVLWYDDDENRFFIDQIGRSDYEGFKGTFLFTVGVVFGS